jgi:hypothetical protein
MLINLCPHIQGLILAVFLMLLGLMIIFLLGLFVCITTGFRMKTLVLATHAVDVPWDSCMDGEPASDHLSWQRSA